VCDDGNVHGADGCAWNCTPETVRDFSIDPRRSPVTTQLENLSFSLNLSGSLKFTTGQFGPDGRMPFVIRAADVQIDRIQVPPIACVCVRSDEVPEFWGAGNVGFGFIGCGDDEFFARDYTMVQDHNIGVVGICSGGSDDGSECQNDGDCGSGDCFSAVDCKDAGGSVEPAGGNHPGVCNGPPEYTVLPGAMRGAAALIDNIGFSMLFDGGTCCTVGVDPDCVDPDGTKGPDGIPCTDDDLVKSPGRNVAAVAGTATAAVHDANNVPGRVIDKTETCGDDACISEVSGDPFDCDALRANPTGGLEGGVFALAFPILDNGDFGDSLATLRLGAVRPVGCSGDCDGNGEVTVNELVSAVAIALGTQAPAACKAADTNSSGEVEVNELVAAVGKALAGCES